MSKELRVIITGSAPISMVAKMADAFDKHCKGGVALSNQHPLCRELGATVVFCAKDDPALSKEGGK